MFTKLLVNIIFNNWNCDDDVFTESKLCTSRIWRSSVPLNDCFRINQPNTITLVNYEMRERHLVPLFD